MAKYTKEIIDEAFQLYARGTSLRAISKQYNYRPSFNTLRSWKNKYEWDKDCVKVDSRVRQDLINDIAEQVAKEDRILDLGLDIIEKDMKEGKLKLKASDAPLFIKERKLKRGEVTERSEEHVTAMDIYSIYEKHKTTRNMGRMDRDTRRESNVRLPLSGTDNRKSRKDS